MRILRRIEIIKIADQKARGIAHAPVGLDQAIQNFIGDADVFAIVLGGDPQAQNLGAEFFCNILRRDGVAHGLGHFSPLAVQGEAMGEHAGVWRAVAGRQRSQQRGMKPAAMLIAAFEIKIRPAAQTRVLFDHRSIADAGIEPDIENIFFAGKILAAAIGTLEIGRHKLVHRPGEPGIRSIFFKDRRDMIADRLGQNGLVTFLAVDRRNRHAPRALARDTPVRSRFEHAANPVATPRRNTT